MNKKLVEHTGTIRRRHHEWYVEFSLNGLFTYLPIIPADAWNLDIEHGLLVGFKLEHGLVRLTWKKGNKKYTKIDQDTFLEHV